MRRAVLLVVLVLAGCGGDDARRTDVTVARVADGDTIRLADGSRVRLVQIDDRGGRGRECYAARAMRALARLVPVGTEVEPERDPALDDRDRFGQALRYVLRDETNVNVEPGARRRRRADTSSEATAGATPTTSSTRPKKARRAARPLGRVPGSATRSCACLASGG